MNTSIFHGYTWWCIPLRKWAIPPVTSGISPWIRLLGCTSKYWWFESFYGSYIYIYKTPPIIIHYWWLLVINSYHIIDGYTMVIPMMQAWDCLRELSLSPPHCPLRISGRVLPGHAEQVQLQRLLQPRKGDQGGGARELHVPGEEGNGDAWFGERLGLRLGYFPKWPQNDHFSREKMGKGVISYFQTPKGRARLGWFAIGWESTMGVGVCVFHVIM